MKGKRQTKQNTNINSQQRGDQNKLKQSSQHSYLSQREKTTPQQIANAANTAVTRGKNVLNKQKQITRPKGTKQRQNKTHRTANAVIETIQYKTPSTATAFEQKTRQYSMQTKTANTAIECGKIIHSKQKNRHGLKERRRKTWKNYKKQK